MTEITKGMRFVLVLVMANTFVGLARADDNECNASVTFVQSNQSNNDPNIWTFTFHVMGGDGPTHESSGLFEYAFTYIDQNNVPHVNTTFPGPSWTPSNGADFDLTDTRSIVGAVSVSAFRITKLSSTSCY